MKIHYFNATHWDREWYYSKEAFRTFLVEMTDKMLNLLDDPETLPLFIFDGQTIVLEDVLEIHPEWRKRLEKAISSQRLKVGPWYVMPDEFTVSGEALVRNLLLGRRIAESFGSAPWNVGYVCDIFGHIAQLPQIFQGFGLRGAVLWRGVPSETGPYFIWVSPDGTEIPAIHFDSKTGYSEFSLRVRGTKDVPLDEGFKQRLLDWLPGAEKYWGENLLCSDAQDHAYPASCMKEIRNILQEVLPDAEIIHTDLTELFDAEFKDTAALPHFSGELIHPSKLSGAGYQICATISSGYDIKNANDRCQNLLELLLEPMTAAILIQGGKCDTAFLRYAWRHLLQNHAHDSICGCSPDSIHRHMLTRFEEVETVAEQQILEFKYQDFEAVTQGKRWSILHSNGLDENSKTEALTDPDGSYLLRIFNPLPYKVDRVSEIEIAFPASKPYPMEFAEPFTTEKINLFRIYDEDGKEAPYSIRSIRRKQDVVLYPGSEAFFDIYTVVMHTELRASGQTSFTIKAVPDPVRNFSTLRTGRRSASNGIIALEIADNGTFAVTDLRSQRTFAGQNDYRIDREIGDGWGHCSPAGTSTTVGGYCRSISITHDGPERVEFEIVREFETAKEMIFAGGINANYEGVRESREKIPLTIRTRVALDRDSDALSISTVIDNNLRDARLQLIIPTGINGKYQANQAFCFNERVPGLMLGRETETFAEAESADKNFNGIVGKKDELGGLYFIGNAGFHECGSAAGTAGELSVTLFRAFTRTVGKNGENEWELQRTLSYEYQLKCTGANTSATELVKAQQIFQLQQLPVSVIPEYLVKPLESRSFAELAGNLAFTALKPAESGVPGEIVLRTVNLTGERQSAKITFAVPFCKAELCRIDESVQQEIARDASTLEFSAKPQEIITVKFTFG